MATQAPFNLSSTAFEDGAAIPRKYTCDGENVSPDLNWRHAPAGTQAMALIVDDLDAHDFAHWLVYDMTGSTSGGLPEAIAHSPDAPPQGRNDFGKVGYGGPCPPSGRHHYRFTLYALNAATGLTGAPRAAELRQALDGRVIGEAVLNGTYQRR